MIIEAFSNNRIVQGLSDKQVKRLFMSGKVDRIIAGKEIINEGQHVESLYVLLAGEVQVFLPESGSRPARVDVTTRKMHECFGEYSFIDKQPASASITALTDCAVYVISHVAFQEFLDKHKKAGFIVYRNLLTVLVERLREDNFELDLFNLH